MNENGGVHPGCANAANPYHECGVHCLEKIAQGKGLNEKNKKKLDNRNGIKEVRNKRTDDGRTVQPNCPKAANPYHECNEFCTQGTSRADTIGVRKQSDNRNGIKKDDFRGRVHSTCRKASNPYHECDENCFKRNSDPDPRGIKQETGSKILDASRSSVLKKKGSESQPKSHRPPEIIPATGAVHPGDPKSPESPFYRKKMEAENGESFSSSEIQSEGIYSRDQSFDKAQIQYSQALPMSGKIMSSGDATTKPKEAEKVQNSPKISSEANTEDHQRVDATSSAFSFLAIAQAREEGDEEEEVEYVISDSCVSVGKYHVKASISSTLQSIFDKYGDIAANCQLESASMRAYYLECLCAVVQELDSITFKELTRAKVKEMFSVVKDVESARIDVSWLRELLTEISEDVEVVGQLQTLESVRKELESRMEELAQKEKEAADAREKVAETKARLDDIEHESSQLVKTVSSVASIMEKFQGKSLADGVL